MKKRIVFILIVLLFCFCNKKQESKTIFSRDLIDSIEKEIIKYHRAKAEGKYIIINFVRLPIFVRVEKCQYLKTNSFELYKIYTRDYNKKFKRFSFFLDEITNNGLELKEKDFINKSFKLDEIISENFENFKNEEFLRYYSDKDNLTNKIYLSKKINSENKFLSISYLLFTKSYYLSDDDLEGKSYILKYPLVGNY